MNRPIKFRAWDKKLGKMMPWNPFIRFDDPEYEVMQFTGLHDKNGHKIYEGDILDVCGWRGAKHKVMVEYQEVEASDDMGSNMIGFRRMDEYGSAEVIGNIFETPELIKNK